MDAYDHTVKEILADGRRFMVPLYQRKYQWHDFQLDSFWDDVEAKAIEVIEGESKFQHYMGALILAPILERAQFSVTPRVQVVDGQQRLTTFQLFLSALREVALKHGCNDIAEHVRDYLFNELKSKDTDKLTRFKLTPTPTDQEIFHNILDEGYSKIRSLYNQYYWGNRVPKNTQFRALRAYEKFYQLIDNFVKSGSEELHMIDEEEGETQTIADETDSKSLTESRLVAVLDALLNRIKLVVIMLGEKDDAQVIFETLNSKSEPLLAMDLVRNNIFYRAEKEQTEVKELYDELWVPFDRPWWTTLAPNARPKRPRIDHFLTHVLAAETGQKISMRELYAEYRAFAAPQGKPRFDNVEDELRVLRKYSPIYETLEDRIMEDTDLHWLGRKLSAWQVTTAYPIAMQIGVSDICADEKRVLNRLIYSYIVRRALSGLTAKNLNYVFQGLSQIFLKEGPNIDALEAYFAIRSGDSNKFPEDQEFRQSILCQPAYKLAPNTRIKDVLWELEEASRPEFAEKITMPSGLQTEHVLPFAWTEDKWPFEDNEIVEHSSSDENVERRNLLLHSLGNLTLLTTGLNKSSGNKGFVEKREKLEKHTGLFLNKWFLSKNSWNETHILDRGKFLATMAVRIWPTPQSARSSTEDGESERAKKSQLKK